MKFLTRPVRSVLDRHGVPIVEFEPNLLLALEVKHSDILVGNEPQSFYSASDSAGQSLRRL